MARLEKKLRSQVELDAFLMYQPIIWKDCQPFLKEMVRDKHYEPMYSGRKSSEEFFTRAVRKNRKPTDTHLLVSKDLDEKFQGMFGYPARSNSIFCTGDLSDSEEYGSAYMIFPIGKYKYLWSDDIGDLYLHLTRFADDGVHKRKKGNPLLQHFVDKEAPGIDIYDLFGMYFEEVSEEGGEYGQYVYEDENEEILVPKNRTKEAEKYVKANMMDPDDYYLFNLVWYPIDYDEFYRDNFDRWKKETIAEWTEKATVKYEEFLDELVSSYDKTNLSDAINSGNEIMLNCNKYHAWDARQYGYYFEMYLREFGIKGHKGYDEVLEWWTGKMRKS